MTLVMWASYLLEKLDNGILIHGKVEVARYKDKCKVGACFLGQSCLRNDFPCALPSTSQRDGNIWSTELSCELACCADKVGLFLMGQGYSLSVGAGKYN